MSGAFSSQDSAERVLAAALALLRVDVLQEVLNAKLFDQRYPKLLPLSERRPVILALVGVAVLFVAIIVVVSLVAALG